MVNFTSFGFSPAGLVLFFLFLFFGSFGFPGAMIAIITFSSFTKDLHSLLIVMLIVYLAAAFGDIMVYETARRFSPSLIPRLRKFSFFLKAEKKSRELLAKHEFSIVFFTRFGLISLCAPMNYISGFEKFSRKKFLHAVFLGEFLYGIIYPLIGFFGGVTLGDLFNAVNDFAIAAVIGLVVLYLIFSFVYPRVKKWVKKEEKELKTELKESIS